MDTTRYAILDGISSADKGLMLSGVTPLLFPRRSRAREPRLRNLAALESTNWLYEPAPVRLTFTAEGTDKADLVNKIQGLTGWLLNASELRLWYDPEKYYQGSVEADPDAMFSQITGQYATFSVDFICNPPCWQRARSDNTAFRPSALLPMPEQTSLSEHIVTAKTVAAQTVTVQGKNLLDKMTTRTVHGVTITVATDGTITLNGTCTEALGVALIAEVVMGAALDGTYTLSMGNPVAGSANLQVRVVGAAGIIAGFNISASTVNNKCTYTVAGQTATKWGIRFQGGDVFNNYVIKPQFEAGAAVTSYALFVPTSPSPRYPAPITGKSSAKMWRILKNLAPRPTVLSSVGITAGIEADGTIVLNGTAAGNAFIDAPAPVVNAGSHMLSANNNVANSGIMVRLNTSGSIDLILDSVNASRLVNVTDPALVNIVRIRVTSGITLSNFRLKIQLETGSIATAYEPYDGTEITLTPASPLYGLAGAEDEIGNDGHETHKTYLYTLNGTENWTLQSVNALGIGNFQLSGGPGSTANPLCISSHFLWDSNAAANATRRGVFKNSSNPNIFIRMEPGDLTEMTVTAFKAWLAAENAAGRPVQVLYQLATPTTTQGVAQRLLRKGAADNLFSDAAITQVQTILGVQTAAGKFTAPGTLPEVTYNAAHPAALFFAVEGTFTSLALGGAAGLVINYTTPQSMTVYIDCEAQVVYHKLGGVMTAIPYSGDFPTLAGTGAIAVAGTNLAVIVRLLVIERG